MDASLSIRLATLIDAYPVLSPSYPSAYHATPRPVGVLTPSRQFSCGSPSEELKHVTRGFDVGFPSIVQFVVVLHLRARPTPATMKLADVFKASERSVHSRLFTLNEQKLVYTVRSRYMTQGYALCIHLQCVPTLQWGPEELDASPDRCSVRYRAALGQFLIIRRARTALGVHGMRAEDNAQSGLYASPPVEDNLALSRPAGVLPGEMTV
ncbi:hypothetical protein NM688_g7246 [Phlebia brevispora]|uniref:Uncharacterized protein n=1 Tax=Phlebia brevispora TaxID=194682 RepID=A0ACC1S7I4_9APHY|nr:hypothetical protein NM688_g7246 [Phlebia brevispora]